MAIGRAIVREPRVFLLDEPISHLDAKLRTHMRGELKLLQRNLGTTMIYVTHDQMEAMSMADRIAIMNFGVLQQVGTPFEIFNRPVNQFVAGFVGDPPMNFIDCDLEVSGEKWQLVNESFRINLLPTTSHVYFGSVIRALPDGRKAGEPLSEGISPVQGADKNGPTGVIKSAAKIDHLRTGGTLLNQKFSPSFFTDETSIIKVSQLIRSYFRLDGHHIQFNVVSADTLRDAQKHPEKYRDLIVRVAGYSDYFNDLGEDLQNEIIRRTEHEEM